MASLVRALQRLWWLVLTVWALLVALLVAFAPSFDEVATFDDTSFLPEGSAALEGNRLVEEGWPEDDLTNTITVVVERDGEELAEADLDHLGDIAAWLASPAAPRSVGTVTTHLDDPYLAEQFVSEDGQAAFLLAGLTVPSFTPGATDAVQAIRAFLRDHPPPEGLAVHVTGSAAVATDESVAVETTVARTTWLTLTLVAGILLWVYRSPIASLVPLVTIGVAFVTSRALVALLAQAGMQVSALFETFAIVIVFGAGTDYCLFLLSRYHEEVYAGTRAGYLPGRRLRLGTLAATTFVMVTVLGSSAATTIVGFSSLAAAQFGLYRTMGPALAVAIGVTVLTALTLTPALMRVAGRWLFWPERWGQPQPPDGEEAPLVSQQADRLRLADLPRRAAAGTSREAAGREVSG